MKPLARLLALQKSLPRPLFLVLAFIQLHLPVVIGAMYALALMTVTGLYFGIDPGLGPVLLGLLAGYGFLALVTTYLVTAFTFRSEAIGIYRFRDYIRETDQLRYLAYTLAASMIWPLWWYTLTRDSEIMYRDWTGVFIEPTVCLVNTWRHGHRKDAIEIVSAEIDGTTHTAAVTDTDHYRPKP